MMLNLAATGRSIPEILIRKVNGLLGPGSCTNPIVDQLDLLALDEKLRIILPPAYQDRYEDIQPVSMGSAGLQYDSAGQVAWDGIWGSFCHLAMAGGPPHKGKLLEPASPGEIQPEPERYAKVIGEICRGVGMVSNIVTAERSPNPGWVRVICPTEAIAGWLARAIIMENVSVRLHGRDLELPAGPHYRIEKEIKNVITALAKTCHYYVGHMEEAQQRKIGKIFADADTRSPLIQPIVPGDVVDESRLRDCKSSVAGKLAGLTGLRAADTGTAGWLSVETGSVRGAIWMMRALVVSNVLARREDTSLCVPIHPYLDPDGDTVADAVSTVYRLARARGLFKPQA